MRRLNPLLLLLAVDVWGLRFYVDPDPAKGTTAWSCSSTGW